MPLKLSYSVHGPTVDKSRGTVVFMHGWPDNSRMLYSRQVAHLVSKGYRCVTINNLNALGPQEQDYYVKWGADFETIIELMHDIIGNTDICGKNPVNLFIHDWGSIHGYMYEEKYPERVGRIFALDVGFDARPTVKEGIVILLYQYTLIFAFLIYNLVPIVGPAIGNAMNKAVLAFFRYPAVLRGDYQTAAMNFSYFYYHLAMIKALIFGMPPREKVTGIFRLAGHKPHCPVFFGYASKSPIRFHGDKWAAWLKSQPDSVYKAYPSQHWITVQCGDDVNRDAEDFFNKTQK